MEWGFIILLVLAVPIVIIWPLLIWTGAMSGLYQLFRKRVWGRAKAHQTQKVTAVQKTTRE